MRETSKANTRRIIEAGIVELEWAHVFQGRGIDVGSGDDPFNYRSWPLCSSCKHFDLPDGAGDDLTQFIGSNEQFDFTHGSQVLEHAIDPAVMLRSWLKVLKPSGYLVATVPDWELYEGCVWPSRWNAGHRTSWSLDGRYPFGQSPMRELPSWLHQFTDQADIKLCRLVDTNYDYSVGASRDQTWDFDKGVEAFIEFVLQRK